MKIAIYNFHKFLFLTELQYRWYITITNLLKSFSIFTDSSDYFLGQQFFIMITFAIAIIYLILTFRFLIDIILTHTFAISFIIVIIRFTNFLRNITVGISAGLTKPVVAIVQQATKPIYF